MRKKWEESDKINSEWIENMGQHFEELEEQHELEISKLKKKLRDKDMVIAEEQSEDMSERLSDTAAAEN